MPNETLEQIKNAVGIIGTIGGAFNPGVPLAASGIVMAINAGQSLVETVSQVLELVRPHVTPEQWAELKAEIETGWSNWDNASPDP